jgi:hypothetical protein
VRHYLTVAEYRDGAGEESLFTVEHPLSCSVNRSVGVRCDVDGVLDGGSVTVHFVHVDDPCSNVAPARQRVTPGRYEIEAWLVVCPPRRASGLRLVARAVTG